MQVDLGGGLYADSERITTFPRRLLGEEWDPATPAELIKIAGVVRGHLCIDQLTAREPALPRFVEPDIWAPAQGDVRWVDDGSGDPHMHVAVSSDQANATNGFTTMLPTTSRPKPHFEHWEVRVGPRSVVRVGNLVVVDNARINSSRPNRPGERDRITPAEGAVIASRLETVLQL
jgi:mRNA-degrading endonuclease toxin of MazEF toxin-antitoxin module